MEQSLYFNITEKMFPTMVTAIIEKLNEKNQTTLPYLFKQLLVNRFTPDGRWSSIKANYTRVAADVVSMDSPLPLKSRDSIETATGMIPKIGMKIAKNEKQMRDIDSLIAQNLPPTTVLANIFEDVPRCVTGIDDRLEDVFLSQLSTGVGVSSMNNGTGVRIDIGVPAENQFNVTKAITEADATPLDDIQKVVDKSIEDMNVITDVYMDDTALQALYKNAQVRAQFAFNQGIATNGSSVIPILDLDKIQQIFMTKWNIRVHRVARSIKTEINGKKQNHSPWKKGMMSFVCDDVLGTLVWTNLAEATRPVAGVQYQQVQEYTLVSQYSTNDPLNEITSAQAMAIPVIDNSDRIYLFDTQTVAA